MIDPGRFVAALESNGMTFFAGVPDSLLSELLSVLSSRVPDERHVITANEGGAVALAIGYHLATGAIPVVYLQNSGLGNIVNPLLTLADPDVYRIPMLFVIGWRGEPGVPDEPQHAKQGRVLIDMLCAMEISHSVLDAQSAAPEELIQEVCRALRTTGKPHALLVKRSTFSPTDDGGSPRVGAGRMTREQAIEVVLSMLEPSDLVVATTGMASREVFEYRSRRGLDHSRDFLTIGGMGHCSQVALGIALFRPQRTIICLDGDGALLMHMGGLSTIGTRAPGNFRHIVLNNGAHDSVGGQPTVALDVDLSGVARACGYRSAERVEEGEGLGRAVLRCRSTEGPQLIEVVTACGAREDLGRPTISPLAAKVAFMRAMVDG